MPVRVGGCMGAVQPISLIRFRPAWLASHRRSTNPRRRSKERLSPLSLGDSVEELCRKAGGFGVALLPYIFRIETARYGGIVCALDNRPPVRKHRHLIRRYFEAQREFIGARLAEQFQARLQLLQVQNAASLANLHGVSSTQNRGGPPILLQ